MNSFFFLGSVSRHSLTQKQNEAYELAEVGGSDQNYFEFWENFFILIQRKIFRVSCLAV